MVETIKYNDSFYEVVEGTPGKKVAYGIGHTFYSCAHKIGQFDILCDKNLGGTFINNRKIYAPNELEKINEQLYIVVFVKSNVAYREIVEELKALNITAKVTNIYDNCAFNMILNSYVKINVPDNTRMKINIVYNKDGWIFNKFADKMYSCLKNEGIDVTVSDSPRRDVDLNHHIPYLRYDTYTNDTLMITHVDSQSKVDRLKEQLIKASVGICMSKDTRDKLVALGVPAYKLCYINPAQDNIIKPKKYGIAITHRCYDDFDVRKRAGALLDVLSDINPDYFKFCIMGAGWDNIVAKLRSEHFEVDYYDDFEYEKYVDLMGKADYYLYMGFDEGSMGYLDAMAAGLGTIVTPQGYHLDTGCPIDYPCSNIKEFHEAFLDLQMKREKRIQSVSTWSWENYTMKHIQLWKYILRRDDLKNLYSNQLVYEDGLYSLLVNNVEI